MTDGGIPAFPTTEDTRDPGIPLRAWYAGMAMEGILASMYGKKEVYDYPPPGIIAAASFELADAMIVELERRTQ